jgi:hypothetical protein
MPVCYLSKYTKNLEKFENHQHCIAFPKLAKAETTSVSLPDIGSP